MRWPDRFQPKPSWETQLCALICVQLHSTACGWRACCPPSQGKLPTRVWPRVWRHCTRAVCAERPTTRRVSLTKNAIHRVKDTSASGRRNRKRSACPSCKRLSWPIVSQIEKQGDGRLVPPSCCCQQQRMRPSCPVTCFAAAATEIIDVVLHFPPLRQEPPHPRQNVPKCNCELNRAVIRRRFRPKEHGVKARHLWEPASVEVEAPALALTQSSKVPSRFNVVRGWFALQRFTEATTRAVNPRACQPTRMSYNTWPSNGTTWTAVHLVKTFTALSTNASHLVPVPEDVA